MVASDNIALFVHAQAAVGITIVSKTNIQALLHNKLLKALDMGWTCIVIDVQTIRIIIDDIGICAKRIEHGLCDIPGATIGAIQTDLDTLEGVDAQRDQVAHVAVATCHIVHSAADVLTMSKGQLWPVLIKDMEFAINVVLHQQQSFLRHFLAVAVD